MILQHLLTSRHRTLRLQQLRLRPVRRRAHIIIISDAVVQILVVLH